LYIITLQTLGLTFFNSINKLLIILKFENFLLLSTCYFFLYVELFQMIWKFSTLRFVTKNQSPRSLVTSKVNTNYGKGSWFVKWISNKNTFAKSLLLIYSCTSLSSFFILVLLFLFSINLSLSFPLFFPLEGIQPLQRTTGSPTFPQCGNVETAAD